MGRKFLLVATFAGLVVIASFVFRGLGWITDGTLIALVSAITGLIGGYVGLNVLQKNIESSERKEIGGDRELP